MIATKSCVHLFIVVFAVSSLDVFGYVTSRVRLKNAHSIRHRRLSMVTPDESHEKILKNHEEIWEGRRGMVRGAIGSAKMAASFRSKLNDMGITSAKEDSKDGAKGAILITAFAIAAGATTLRIGGRAALMQVLGLDMVADTGVKDNVLTALAYLDSLGSAKFAAFFVGWVISKNLCLDFLSIFLALSSGVLFGGVLEGAFASVLCATLASIIGFQLARSFLREKVEEEVKKRPALKAVERAVSKDGFKTVLTLRLVPLLPIPLGGYNYVYGITNVPLLQFAGGTLVGSIKPYLLDSYLGVFGKSIIDGGSSGTSDLALLGTFAAAVLVGTLASQVASGTWDEINKEMKREDGELGDDKELSWTDMWGIQEEKLPKGVKDFNRKASAAEELFRKVVEEEIQLATLKSQIPDDSSDSVDTSVADTQTSVKLETNELFPVAPCPPPLKDDGTVDYSTYLAESWVFNSVLWGVLSKYSNPTVAASSGIL